MSLRVLIVCTANVCRSPMAEALLRRHCQVAGVDAMVASAGTQTHGLPVDDLAVEAVASYGLEISGHRPRPLTETIVDADGADLVLAMTRGHLRAAATTAGGSFRRTFTVRELARRFALVPPERGEGLTAWLDEIGKVRAARDLMGEDPFDDISDPYGSPFEAHRVCAAELHQLTEMIARHLASLAGADVSGPT